MGLLDGKVVIVTGGGNGIGRATALALAASGAQVVVNDNGVSRSGEPDVDSATAVAREIQQLGGQAVVNTDSVADAAGAARLIDLAQSHFGRLDGLVNNAGILRDRTLLNMTEAEFDEVMLVHTKGTFLCMQAAAKAMKLAGGGSIVNTTSVSGLRGNFGQINYSAANAAIYGMTRTASIELQRHRIRVNAVAPLAKTRMTSDLPLFETVSSMGPEHVAPVHVFLQSSLSHDVTGMVLSIAGGRLSTYRLAESPGEFKETDGGIWTAEEIGSHFAAIKKG